MTSLADEEESDLPTCNPKEECIGGRLRIASLSYPQVAILSLSIILGALVLASFGRYQLAVFDHRIFVLDSLTGSTCSWRESTKSAYCTESFDSIQNEVNSRKKEIEAQAKNQKR